MKLDRNSNPDGTGKYALVLMREVPDVALPLLAQLKEMGCLDYGNSRDSEFFVIRLKDKAAACALHAYAEFIELDDPEFAAEVNELSNRAYDHPSKKMPD